MAKAIRGLFFGGNMKLFKLLLSERGEVGGGDTGDKGDQAQTQDPDPQTQAAQPESFIDPGSLPEELKPHWQRMHATFQKRMNEFKASKEKVEAYDRFMDDPEYARATIMQYAPQLGVQLAQAAQNGQAAPNAGQGRSSDVPPQILETVRNRLPAELQWMAEIQAATVWEATKALMTPYLQEQRKATQKQREAKYDELAGRLSEQAPGWESHEDDMDNLREFLQDKEQLEHPRWGNKLELLYNLATGNSLATRQAVNRMGAAARMKGSISTNSTRTSPNIVERVKNAKNDQEAMEIAAEAAMKEHGLA